MLEEKESWRRDESQEKGNTRREVKSMRLDPVFSLSDGYQEGKQASCSCRKEVTVQSHSSRY